ncbi:hypothetical protein [[Mycobacterium] nativiensis]|uniref:Uncharacterized protein n=1 Tax=[Mycobacterium] nativiensis TaxID=2855503 RepID=A0ABU5XVK9_9MYCO|nr:hypothetical protein [Mycolicibacter sp. MYC340]MEB3031506.1 hypothetical protein [Mycolicibacter sp. MYC340]
MLPVHGGPLAASPLPSIRPRWNPVVTNWSGFGVYRVRFEDTVPCYVTPLMKLPIAGLDAPMEGPDGLGLAFQMSLPPREFSAMSNPTAREHLHRFRGAGDELPHLN